MHAAANKYSRRLLRPYGDRYDVEEGMTMIRLYAMQREICANGVDGVCVCLLIYSG